MVARCEIDVLMTPADFGALAERDLSDTVCVVFDVLRATSSMVVALAHGARELRAVETVAEALAEQARRPDALLGGERMGFRIRAEVPGAVDFDLGNSPREYVPERVRGRSIVTTTTNGTRALGACRRAGEVWVGSFLNLSAVVQRLMAGGRRPCLLVCGGTYEEAAYEDVLAAGAVAWELRNVWEEERLSDAVAVARELYDRAQGDLLGALRYSRNARRLMAIPELAADVAYCLQRDLYRINARLQPDGWIRRCD